ncbi:hypothetical protein DPMN_110100 [Dreissena polymorpha]|uniref:Uncharacterized protein n=1 Tax=Dreissena polymorpha TaxID=45954 RepID=A0A9D4KCI4_DREPO|nr:hypothetical protein DPMN_110100 [Dreissena polymorpha]
MDASKRYETDEVLCDETPLVDPEEPEVLIATRVRDYLVRNEGAEDNESDQGENVQETGDAHDDALRNVLTCQRTRFDA